MIKSSRLSLRLQTRSFKNTFFQLNDPPFKGLLPDSLIEAILKPGDVRSTVFTPLVDTKSLFVSGALLYGSLQRSGCPCPDRANWSGL